MSIERLQEGGFVTYRPIPITPRQVQDPPTQTEVPDKKEEGLDPEILKKMVGEGITTDVMAYSQQVNSAYQQYAMMSDDMKNSFRGRQLRMIMKGDLGQLNALARAKKYLDNSLEEAGKNGALDEAAVTTDGVMVKDTQTGRVGQISFAQYNQIKDKSDSHLQLLTNAELANEREVNPTLLGRSDVFSVIKFGTGLEKIKEEVYKALPSIGSSSITKSTGAFGGALNDEAGSDSAQALENAAAAGAFRIKDGETIQTNSAQIEKAKRDLWNNLSAGAKATLRLKAAQLVNDPSQIDVAASTLAASLLDPKLTTINKEIHDETYKRMLSGKGSGEKQEPVGPNEMAFNFRGHNANVVLTGPKGSKIDTMGAVLPVDNYQANDGKRTTLQDATAIARIGDVHNAFTVNGDHVDPKRTMINGRMYFTYLPIVEGPNGVGKVDEEGAAKFAQLQKEHPDENPGDLYKQYGVSLNLKPVVIGEAVSFSDHMFGWMDGRDKDYYTPADNQTEKYAREIIDPKHKDVAGLIDNTAHTHLIIMPAGNELDFRNSDNNKVYAPQTSFDVRTYNTGPTGANADRGLQYNPPVQSANMTTQYWQTQQ